MDYSCACASHNLIFNMDDPALWTKLANYVLTREDIIPADAFFVHASGDLYDETLELIAKLYNVIRPRGIFLNGLGQYATDFPGIEYWRNILVEKYHISLPVIRVIQPAIHTLAEANEFIRVAEAEKITTALVISVPVHILRAFLTNVGVLQKLSLPIKIYPQTFKNSDWEKKVVIRGLEGVHVSDDTVRVGRFAGECARIMKYRQLYKQGNDSYCIASIEEGISYIEKELQGKL